MMKKYKAPYRSPAWYREVYWANREGIVASRKRRYALNAERHRERDRSRYISQRKYIVARESARILRRDKVDPVFRAKRRKHTHFRNWIMTPHTTVIGMNKVHPKYGMSWLQYRVEIEKRFSSGMSWENHGLLWEFDHIIPASTFDLRDPKQVVLCFNISNIRPLPKHENAARKRKYN